MLERQYDSPAAVERVRSSVLGIHADALTQFLVSRGHARYTINVYLNALEHLGLIFRAQVTCPPFPSTYCASPRQRFEYSIGVDPNSELCGLFSL